MVSPRDINALGTATKHLDANGKLLTEDEAILELEHFLAWSCHVILPGSVSLDSDKVYPDLFSDLACHVPISLMSDGEEDG